MRFLLTAVEWLLWLGVIYYTLVGLADWLTTRE